MDLELAELREKFGDDAEEIYRGLVIAYEQLDSLPEALEVVLDVRGRAGRSDDHLHDLEARVSEAMIGFETVAFEGNIPEGDDEGEPGTGPICRLREDMNTSLGGFDAGTYVRAIYRRANGELLVRVLDLHGTVFPVSGTALEPLVV
jgi:hypothetical protein